MQDTGLTKRGGVVARVEVGVERRGWRGRRKRGGLDWIVWMRGCVA